MAHRPPIAPVHSPHPDHADIPAHRNANDRPEPPTSLRQILPVPIADPSPVSTLRSFSPSPLHKKPAGLTSSPPLYKTYRYTHVPFGSKKNTESTSPCSAALAVSTSQ